MVHLRLDRQEAETALHWTSVNSFAIWLIPFAQVLTIEATAHGGLRKGRRMSQVEKMIGMFCALVVSLTCATLACSAAFSILIRLPVSNPFVWWSLDSYTGLATVFGSLFLFTFCVLMSLYRLAVRRAQ
jgi:hypothetical protein